jgi:hypothetical protein
MYNVFFLVIWKYALSLLKFFQPTLTARTKRRLKETVAEILNTDAQKMLNERLKNAQRTLKKCSTDAGDFP